MLLTLSATLLELVIPTSFAGLLEPTTTFPMASVVGLTVAVCAFFTSFTGASGVTILALGGLLMPVLKGARFSDKDSLGLLTGSGSLGLLLPPCLPLIVYAIVAILLSYIAVIAIKVARKKQIEEAAAAFDAKPAAALPAPEPVGEPVPEGIPVPIAAAASDQRPA